MLKFRVGARESAHSRQDVVRTQQALAAAAIRRGTRTADNHVSLPSAFALGVVDSRVRSKLVGTKRGMSGSGDAFITAKVATDLSRIVRDGCTQEETGLAVDCFKPAFRA